MGEAAGGGAAAFSAGQPAEIAAARAIAHQQAMLPPAYPRVDRRSAIAPIIGSGAYLVKLAARFRRDLMRAPPEPRYPRTAMSPRRILVTSALPYANGQIHLGHLLETIQADIWVRFQRLRGHECYYVCADDTHGTPIMLSAEKADLPPEELIERMRAEHLRDFAAFGISFDHYGSTHSEHNRRFVHEIYRSLLSGGHVVRRAVRQFYDPEREMFLPDRFIKGTCPRCGTPDHYGDSCDACGSTYTPAELGNPVSAITGARPVERESEHVFVKLANFSDLLRGWVTPDRLQPEVVNKLGEWLEPGLQDWDISRDEPYFGFEIPDAPGKYFYVWVDAPIGYLASFRELCDQQGLDFDAFWRTDRQTEVYHFIGKDIIYFHCLYWPVLLSSAGYRLPSAVWAHGFLTVKGAKMSKSRGTFIEARTYVDHLDPEYLRYYLAAKLGSGLADIDLNLPDFVARVNSDLVGKVVNIASRCAPFLPRFFGGRLGEALDRPELHAQLAGRAEAIAEAYEQRDTNRAVRLIMAAADEANRYIDERKPWLMARDPAQRSELHAVATSGLNLFRLLAIWLKPIVPRLAERAEGFLGVAPLRWSDGDSTLTDHPVQPFTPLLVRIEEKDTTAMIESSKPRDDAAAKAPTALERLPLQPEIDYDAFARIDLRVARILGAEAVEGADKLLRLRLDLGGEERTVFAGIKSAYDPEALIGRLTVVVANLKPRQMRFGVSSGMVLAAGPGGAEIFLLKPDAGAQPGQRVT